MQVLHVNGCGMAYVEQGAGAPVLLVHGALCDCRYWSPQMKPFGQHYRTLAVSLRHFWPACWDGEGDGFTVEQHAEDLAGVITALGTGPVHLVGHSRGGYVAFLVARRFPERVRTLVLAEPGGGLDQSLRPTPAQPEVEAKAATFDDAAAHLRRGDVDSGLAIFVDIVSGRGAWGRLREHAKQVMRDNAYTLLGQIREQRPPFTRSDVEAIQAPTLLVGAANSPPFYREILDALERHLKQVRRATIPDASHPMNHDNTGAFNGTVLDFLASYAG